VGCHLVDELVVALGVPRLPFRNDASSIEAFARTLRVHRRTVAKQKANRGLSKPAAANIFQSFAATVDADDDRATMLPEDLTREEDSQVEAATAATFYAPTKPDVERLLEQMTDIAETARGNTDTRVLKLIEWIREKMLTGKNWTNTRVIVFTEFEATLTYLREQIESAISATDRPEVRIAIYRGSTPQADRGEIKRAFNTDPARHRLRILLCTDAAREGINLQSFCADLFHFDVSWNPSRMEQRNGRIDRKLQPSPEVRCHYFVYKQRPEDRILRASFARRRRSRRNSAACPR
jgi:SNF2 family DNA or RNA helicase